MGLHIKQDVGAVVKGAYGGGSNTAGAPSLVVAGGAGDATAVTGATIDRHDHANAESCKVQVCGLMALQENETCAVAVEIQESSDGAAWDSAEELQASATAATGGSGGSNEGFAVNLDVSLAARKRYFRINHTPDLSAADTDTGYVLCCVTLGGGDTLPTS